MQNLASRTDAIFLKRDGFLEEHSDYWVIRTPDNPTFWFGNYILFKKAPGLGDLARWREIHDTVFDGSLNHMVLGWDEPALGETQQFVDAGLVATHGIALSLHTPPQNTRTNPNLVVRRLQGQSEWDAMTRQQYDADLQDFAYPGDDGVFRASQMAAAKRMADDGQGDWWGAFLDDQLVGGMGLFFDEARTIGRFQYVTTAITHRRQRVCTTILDHVVRDAFDRIKPEVLVICTGAEDDNPASPAYRNFGFREEMRNYAFRMVKSASA